MIVTLALGIGATTAVFTVVDEILLRPVPFAFPDRLVDVLDTNRATRGGGSNLAPEKIAGWQASPLFERFEGYSPRQFDISGEGEPERAMGLIVTSGLFSMLGVQPTLGRGFASDEGKSGSPKVVIIDDGLWKRRFGTSGDVLGQSLTLNDEPYTIVGVMPRRFHLLGNAGTKADLFWLPLDVSHPRVEDSVPAFYGLGRLARGVALPSVQTRANSLADEYQRARPLPRTWDLMIRQKTVSSVNATARTLLFVLLGAVGFVLLIACANVTNLFLSHAASRERETAVRSALGASRSRLMREVLVEGLILSTVGGAGGVLLAGWGIRAAVAAAPPDLAFMTTTTIEIDGRILAVAALLTIAATLIVALIPAWRGSRTNLESTRRSSGQHFSRNRSLRSSGLIVVAEVALALMLMVATALMTRTFARLHAIDPGFALRNLATMRVALPSDRYPTSATRFAFIDELSQRVLRLPGVSAVTVAAFAGPPAVAAFSNGIEGEGSASAVSAQTFFAQNTVATNYFQTLQIPLMSGRTFSDQDADDTVIVSQAVIDQFWPGQAPVGRRLRFGPTQPWQTIVGVVGNVEMRLGDQRLPRQVYARLVAPRSSTDLPSQLRRRTYYPFVLTVRASDARTQLATLKNQVWAANKNQPVESLGIVEDDWANAFGRQRFALLLMSVFAAIALILASAGVLAVLSQFVSQRTREIGVRVALGATSGDVFRLIVGRGMTLTMTGIAIGLGGAIALSRFLTSLLFEVSPYDPASFAAVTVLVVAVSFLACWLPTMRAMRVEPAVSLRVE